MPEGTDRCVRTPSDRPDDRTSQPKRRAGFRDDIQGMRALAVLAIMVFHAGFSPYPGGFVTLDVFFVLSGFLITHLLVRELDRSGTISLTSFYARRARRILPAATVATIGTLVATWLWLGVVEVRDTAVDAAWTALFAANVRFAMQETDYFAQDQAPSPLQHYWSLAVEEQFYLLLPLLVLGCALLARGVRRRGSIAIGLGVLTAASLGWSVHASTSSPDTAYFSTFTRAWEFGVGALLALAAPLVAGRFGAVTRALLALAGLGLIVVACFTITSTDPFPGWRALLPVLGTGAVLVAGAEATGRPGPVQRALGCRPLRFVGDASYSLYLWHWPVLVIATQRAGRDLRPAETLLVLGVGVGMALLSHRFVERPFRRPVVRLPRQLALYPLSVALVLAGSLGAVRWAEHPPGRETPGISADQYAEGPAGERVSDEPAVALVQASVRAAREGKRIPSDLRPDLLDLADDKADTAGCEYDAPPYELCRRGDTGGKRTIVVLGDSHGRHWIPAFERLAKRTGHAVYYLVKSACNPNVRGVPARDGSGAWVECADFSRWARAQVAALEPDLVVLSGAAPRGVATGSGVATDADTVGEAVRRGYRSTIRQVSPHAGEVVVLADVPRRRTEPAVCLGARGADLGDCLDPVSTKQAATIALTRAATRGTGARFVATKDWFCAAGQCPAVVGDVITLRDNGHLTTAYAAELAEPLRQRLGLRKR